MRTSKAFSIAIACLAFTSLFPAKSAAEEKATAAYAGIPAPVLAASQAILQLRSPDENCSGFMLEGRRIGTAFHCVSGPNSKKTEVWLGGSRVAHSPKIVKQNRFLDLAILEVPSRQHSLRKWTPIEPAEPLQIVKGQKLYLTGLRTGIHEMRVTLAAPEVPFFETLPTSGDEKACEPGDSGGAFLDENGRLAGIISGNYAGVGGLVYCAGIRADFLARLGKGEALPSGYPASADGFDADLLYADRAVGLDDFQQAIRFLEQAVSLDNSNMRPYADLCKIHFTTKDYQKSIRSCQKASELDASNPEPLFVLADVYRDQGNLEKALEYAKKTLALAPNDGTVIAAMGVILEKLGRLEEAKKAYQDALPNLELDNPNLAKTYFNLFNVFYKRDEYSKCWEVLRTAQRDGIVLNIPSGAMDYLRHHMPEPKQDE